MIVTFHIAIYLVYQFLENYVYPLFDDNDAEESSNDQAEGQNQRVPPANSSAKAGIGNTITTSTSKNEVVGNKQTTDKSTKGVQEGDNIPSLYYDDQEGFKCIYETETKFTCYVDPEGGGPKFVPPVYIQRYMTIAQILNQACWKSSIKKVVDFGCAELSFEVIYLKKLFEINEIVSVDIDCDLLERNVCKIAPTATDYLSQRSTPLSMRVFCGSVGCTNEALDGADAVIAIELIEHLFPDDLERLPFTVFGYINPLLAIFTTPNADFNVLFKHFSGFRHTDHKFEWSRLQFEDWGNNLVLRYPEYTVTYQGIGPGVPGTEHLGCCSQMAVFVKVHQAQRLSELERHIQDGEYKLTREEVYPFFEDKRSRSEKIRDECNFFINRLKSLSSHFDEERVKEIPLKTVMEKVKCYNREKLIGILQNENWNVSTNKAGYEVIEIPESDEESSNSSMFLSDTDYEANQTNDGDWFKNVAYNEECWDCDNNETNSQENGERLLGCSCNSVNCTKKDSFVDCLCTPPCIDSCVSLAKSSTEVIPRYDNICSPVEYNVGSNSPLKPSSPCVIETESNVSGTQSSAVREICPNCELTDLSPLSMSNVQPVDFCNKSISFEANDILCEDAGNAPAISNCKTPQDPKPNLFCCVSNSSCDISTFATPDSYHCQTKILPKSLSLQQINSCSKIKQKLFSQDPTIFGNTNEKFSRSVEGLKSQESCDVLDTLSSISKVVDSGYPDSYSDHDMEMDLTPEQIEDIGSESKSSLSSRSLSPLLLPLHPNPLMIDNVENGDVANNNRDGEGNNMVADMEEEALEFIAQIEEVDHEIPNMGAVQSIENSPKCIEKPGDSEPIPENHLKHYEEQSNSSTALEPQSSWTFLSGHNNNTLNTKEINGSPNKHMSRCSKSDLSIATSSTWSHLESTESQSSCHFEDVARTSFDKDQYSKIKSYNSLTTVLDGCSKFSECSLVRPINNLEHCKLISLDNNEEHRFPFWLLNIDCSIFSSGDEGTSVKKNYSRLPLLGCLSVSSFYQSADSLNSLDTDSTEGRIPFPQWLLNIESSDIEDDRLNQDLNEESFDDVPALIYNVQVDARGGGDPQRESWY